MFIPRTLPRARFFLFGIMTGLLFAGAFTWLVGSSNPSTPAGYVGYLTKDAVFGRARFIGVQRGPVSPGRSWMMRVTNVSVTPYTYEEHFTGDDAVLSRDNLKIAFAVHAAWRIDSDNVPMFMDRYSTTVSHRRRRRQRAVPDRDFGCRVLEAGGHAGVAA